MASQIRLHPGQLADIRAILNIGVEGLSKVIEDLRVMTPLPLRPDELAKRISSVIEDDPKVAQSLLRQAMGLSGLVRQGGMPIQQALETMGDALEQEPDWESDDHDRWRSLQEPLQRLFELPAIRTVTSAIDLSYEYANLLRQVRILTDVRPIFSESGEEIMGAVVSQTLRLRFDSTDGEHGLSIAVDETDIRALQAQCDRALKKAETAKSKLCDKAEVAVSISGHSNDD